MILGALIALVGALPRSFGAAPAALLLQHEHGAHTQPRSPLEYIVVAIAALITAYVLVKAVQMTFRPGEHEHDHIKRSILEDQPREQAREEPSKRV